MTRPITQANVVATARYTGRLVGFRDGRNGEEPGSKYEPGLSWALDFANGYTLSVQGSAGNDCQPRRKADSYESVEIAVYRRNGGPFFVPQALLDKGIGSKGTNTTGWVDPGQLRVAIETVACLDPEFPDPAEIKECRRRENRRKRSAR